MKSVIICGDKFYDLLEDEIMDANVYFDMYAEEERKEFEFDDAEMYAYMVLLNNLIEFIDAHEKKKGS